MNCYRCHVGLPEGAQFCLSCGAAQNAPRVTTDWTKGTGCLAGMGSISIIGLFLGGIFVVAVVVFSVLSQNARERGERLPLPISQVVVNTSKVVRDGESWSWSLPAGHYRLEMTASDDGCTVEWLGGSCPATQPMTRLATDCQLENQGQLIIRNPTTFGIGASSFLTVKVTRLAF